MYQEALKKKKIPENLNMVTEIREVFHVAN